MAMIMKLCPFESVTDLHVTRYSSMRMGYQSVALKEFVTNDTSQIADEIFENEKKIVKPRGPFSFEIISRSLRSFHF